MRTNYVYAKLKGELPNIQTGHSYYLRVKQRGVGFGLTAQAVHGLRTVSSSPKIGYRDLTAFLMDWDVIRVDDQLDAPAATE